MTHLLLTPAPSPTTVAGSSPASTAGRMPAFCEQNRAIIATFLHTQGAVLAMIQSLAIQAVDGQGDIEQTLRRIDLVAARACQESDQMGMAVSSISTLSQ